MLLKDDTAAISAINEQSQNNRAVLAAAVAKTGTGSVSRASTISILRHLGGPSSGCQKQTMMKLQEPVSSRCHAGAFHPDTSSVEADKATSY